MKVAHWKDPVGGRFAPLLVLAAMALSGAAAPRAQCGFEIAPGNALPGVDGAVNDLAWWDSDGPGPAPRRLIVGGTFAVAGTVRAQNIAAYDPAVGAFEPMGAGVPDLVRRIVNTPSGRLLAVAAFDAFVWQPATEVWQPVGGNAFFSLADVLELANGDLLFMGGFTTIAGQNIAGLARFDGSNWTSLGAPTLPFSAGAVFRAVELANGDLIVGGLFDRIGGVPAASVARWDGSSWHELGAGSSWQCTDLILEPSGDVVALGRFDVGTAADAWLARWDGTQWSELAPNTPTGIGPIVRLDNGSYVVATAAGLQTNAVGGVWSPYAAAANLVNLGVLLDDGAGGLVVGGTFESTPDGAALRVAQWNGVQWRSLENGTDSLVERVVAGPSGTFAASGTFSSLVGNSARKLAFYDGAAWSAVAQGSVGRVTSMAFRDSGELVVVAPFSGTVPPGPEVRSWNGSTLDLVGPPGTWASFFPTAVCTARNGDVLIAVVQGFPFNLGVARWDGSSLTTQLFGPIGLGSIHQLVELPNGDLVFAGIFTTGAGGSSNLLRWDGTTLQDLGVNSSVRAMGVMASGELVVAGDFTQPIAKVARFDGTSFHALGAGLVGTPSALAVLPDGDLLVDERFGSSPSAGPHRVMRWDGLQWSELLTLGRGPMGLAASGDGTVLMCGDSLTFGPDVSPYLARFEPTCPAASVVVGAGCSGSVGPIALTVEQLPWLGGVLRTTATGLAPGALAAAVYGFQSSVVPLASISPFGQPGCNLACDPDILFWSGAVAGLLRSELAIPSAPALVGAMFFHQVVPVELDASGQLAALLASDAVQLTIGSL
ncbi:MAG: hypothetical protein AB8H80_15660 [Planctomycetota bacterium]